jgi:hypothetical protein
MRKLAPARTCPQSYGGRAGPLSRPALRSIQTVNEMRPHQRLMRPLPREPLAVEAEVRMPRGVTSGDHL